MRNLLKWHKNLAEKIMIKTGMNAYKLAWFSWVKGLVMGILLALLLCCCSKNYSCNCTTVTTTPEYECISCDGTSLGMLPESSTSTTSMRYVNEKNLNDAGSRCSELDPTSTYKMSPPPGSSDSVTVVMTCTLGEKM